MTTGRTRTHDRLLDRLRRTRDEDGYAAVLVALVVTTIAVGALAVAVDTAEWFVQEQKIQRAADAAALAAVPFMPQDFAGAQERARDVADLNGFCALELATCRADSVRADVDVETTDRATQLKVTVTHRVDNQFGTIFGADAATLRSAGTADFQGPAPMGSPCNTFGNEPYAGSGTAAAAPRGATARPSGYANCDTSRPQFWAGVQGVNTNKSNGDRYMNRYCSPIGEIEGCVATNRNDEYAPVDARGRQGKHGYFWVVRVQEGAQNKPVDLQLYDPAYINSGSFTCSGLPPASVFDDNMNDYATTDGKTRYSSSSSTPPTDTKRAPLCNGDARAGGYGGSSHGFTTSFVLRAPTDTRNPLKGRVMSTEGCVKQYRPLTGVPNVTDATVYNALKKGRTTYNDHFAKLFHNWVSMCTFVPPAPGDYYLQVRTNVAFVSGRATPNTNGNTSLISTGDSSVWADIPNSESGDGSNTFAIRAVPSTTADRARVSVSGYERMPIFANSVDAATTFNLIQVLPGSAGRYISFYFFDVADTDGEEGTVTISLPKDTQVPAHVRSNPFPNGGCRSIGGFAGAGATSSGCSFKVTNDKNNGAVQRIDIPIHPDYDCNAATYAGCWFQVTVALKGQVRDFTTWNATIEGDPVRLVE